MVVMNIKIIQLINLDYIIANLEELDEEPSVYLKNPYKIETLSYWEYNDDDGHVAPENTVFLNQITEKSIKKGEETYIKQFNYASLEKYPAFTNESDILFNSERLITVVEPKPEIAKLYMELISE